MSTHDPSNPESQEGRDKPSFDKQPPQPASPYDAPPPGAGPYTGGAPYGVPPEEPKPPLDVPEYPAGPYGRGMGVDDHPHILVGGWGKRIAARLIDYLIIQAIGFLLVLPFTGFGNRNGWTGGVWVFYGLYLIYEGVMLSRDGQTLGKKVMKIRVATLADGSGPTGSAAWTRAATFTLPAVLCCGLWWLVDGVFGVIDKPYRQCIHDKAAKTVVVLTA